ncbi:MAG: hypothetical protein ACLQJR_09140 [Stellaceae bacterium]
MANEIRPTRPAPSTSKRITARGFLQATDNGVPTSHADAVPVAPTRDPQRAGVRTERKTVPLDTTDGLTKATRSLTKIKPSASIGGNTAEIGIGGSRSDRTPSRVGRVPNLGKIVSGS